MNKYLKMLTVVMLLLVTAFNVSATEDAEISTVTIDDIEFDFDSNGTNYIYAPVYLGSTFEVVVEWTGLDVLNGTILEDVEIEVEFDGDEYESEEFDIESNHIGRQVFEIEIADDEDLLEGTQYITITMTSDNGTPLDIVSIELDIKRERHSIEIFDVNFRNGLQANAGEIFTASIGVSNEGRENEEDVYVVMNIPELGLTTRTDRFDLFTEDYNFTDDDDEYKMYKQLLVNLPLTVPSGVYDVHFKVYFDDGDNYNEEVYTLVVGAGQAYESQISMDTQSQIAGAGDAIVYKVLFENPNVEYDIEVIGLNFGTYEVRTEDDKAYIFVSINEDVNLGEYNFNVAVKAGSNVLEDFDVSTRITNNANSGNSANFSDAKQGLEIGFAVLLVILVILGIVLVAKRLGKGDELEEPMLDEDQTYY